MLFNSYIFIFAFLPVTLIVFYQLQALHLKMATKLWLLITSCFFYAYWNPYYLVLLLVSIGTNYFLGRAIDSTPSKIQTKFLLFTGVAFNLCLIIYYKYADFLASSASSVLNTQWYIPEIILPLAISFYTFTQVAYLVDAYRGETKNSQYDLLSYSLFVIFFPQLIAGPILRHNELIHQFDKLMVSHKNLAVGSAFFIFGLAKKVLIADNLSPLVATVFNDVANVGFAQAWVGALNYTFQLYFDFSGYSDMAIGLGLMLNVHLPINFNSPYKATSIIDFWRRWHITLSNLLRDYLYIPLGGSRRGTFNRYKNLIITMLLGGLWHGAGWTFLVWGGFHGVLLAINHWWRTLKIPLPKLTAWAMTFIAVVISWVFFRAQTLHDAVTIVEAMMGIRGFELLDGGRKNLLFLICLTAGVVLLPNTQEIIGRFRPTWQWAALVSSLATCCLLSLNRLSEFLYFQF